MREHKTKSGKTLKIYPVPFRPAKDLHDVIMSHLHVEKINPEHELDVNFIKGILAGVISSKDVEKALWPCLERSTYDGHKITEDTFDKVEAREDFLEICFEVGKDAVFPFMKNLYQEFWPRIKDLLSQGQK